MRSSCLLAAALACIHVGIVICQKNDSLKRSLYSSIRDLTTFRSSLARHLLSNDSDTSKAAVFRHVVDNELKGNNSSKTNQIIKRVDKPSIDSKKPLKKKQAGLKVTNKGQRKVWRSNKKSNNRETEGTAKQDGIRPLDTGSHRRTDHDSKEYCVPASSDASGDTDDPREKQEESDEREDSDEETDSREDDEENEETHHCKDDDDDDDEDSGDVARNSDDSINESNDDERFNDISFDGSFKPFSSFNKVVHNNWIASSSKPREEKLPTSYARFTKYVSKSQTKVT